MNKELLLGSGAAVLTVVGIYFAIKSSNNQPLQNNRAPSGYSSLTPYASYTPTSGGFSTVATNSTPINSSQTGDLTSVLATNAATAQLNANANFVSSTLNAINAQSATVLARGADLTGRGNGTLALDYTQQSTAAGAPSANGASGSPISTQLTASLRETVPDQHYAPPPPAPVIQQAAAPVIVQQPAPSSSSGGCFITTAICRSLKMPDDNYMLETLRNFRDTYMQETLERKVLVQEYYLDAPIIVEKLSDAQLKELCFNYLIPCFRMITMGMHDKALKMYTYMVTEAKLMTAELNAKRA